MDSNELKFERLSGPIAPVMTAFDTSDNVDFAKTREEMEYLVASGVRGISPGGSTGEGSALTDVELESLVGVAREVAGDLPVVAGIIRSSTRSAVAAAKLARDAGADALMVTPTFYNVLVPDDIGNYEFYRDISDVGLPVIVYNVVPQNLISPALAADLMEIPNMFGVKQSVGGVQAMYEMKVALANKGQVYAATDEMLPTCYSLGAFGAISAIVGLFPKLSMREWDLVQAGKLEEAFQLQADLLPIWQVVRGGQFPSRMKVAAKAVGRDVGGSRAPLRSGDAELQERIERVVHEVSAKVGVLA